MKMKPTLIMQVSCTMGDWSVLKKQKHSEQGDPRGQGSIKEEVVLQPVKARGRGTMYIHCFIVTLGYQAVVTLTAVLLSFIPA